MLASSDAKSGVAAISKIIRERPNKKGNKFQYWYADPSHSSFLKNKAKKQEKEEKKACNWAHTSQQHPYVS